jgi:glutathione S-transferase
MTATDEPVLVGRSSSHFTRTVRIFSLELGVAHGFRPVLDLTTLDRGAYAQNPALKVPILVDRQGPLFGTENICRELARRSGQRERVVLRGDVSERVVANAEEMILHAMGAEVTLIMSGLVGPGPAGAPPSKVRASLENVLGYLDENVDGLVAALPPDRALSFCEASLFCLVTHLPFRNVMSVDRYQRLQAFCAGFGERAGARATGYRFDTA